MLRRTTTALMRVSAAGAFLAACASISQGKGEALALAVLTAGLKMSATAFATPWSGRRWGTHLPRPKAVPEFAETYRN